MTPYYDEGGITIYHGDWRTNHGTAYSRDVVITDPPYGVGVQYDVHDDRDRGEYWAWMNESVVELRKVAPLLVFTHRLAALKNLAPTWDWIYCWNKPMCGSALNALPVMPHWEPVFVYGITGRKDLPRRFDVFNHNPISAQSSEHPCPKPISLYSAFVDTFSLPEHVVLDPFMGSGTTLLAAKAMGRKAIGFDVSERYCEIAAQRCAQEVLDFGAA